jgi:hypothetical protein
MYSTIAKDSDVPAPALTFDFVEDTDWRGINDGTWVVNWELSDPGSFTWVDPLAMYHGNNNVWAFVDGHVDTHKWTDQIIITEGMQAAQGQEVEGFSGSTSGPDYTYVRNGLRFPGWE